MHFVQEGKTTCSLIILNKDNMLHLIPKNTTDELYF